MISSLSALPLFAQAAPASPGGLVTFLPLVLLVGGMYFLMIAPQRKKQKAHEKMLTELQSGDEVITTGGIYATITNVKEDRFVLRVSDSTKIEVGKGFIQSVTKRNGVDQEKK